MLVSAEQRERLSRDRRFFLDSALPGFEPLPSAAQAPPDYATSRLLSRFGRGR